MNALLLGYYGAKNLGDDMMLHCILRWLALQGINTTVVSEDPEETMARFPVATVRNAPLLVEWGWYDSWFRGHTWRLIRCIRGNDILVVGGGDLIRDDKGWRTFWYTIEKILVALLFRKKIFLVNIGIVGPTTRWGKSILGFVIRNCSRIIVRDEASYRCCLKLGKPETCILKPDIVLTLPKFLPAVRRESDMEPYMLVCLRKEPNDFGTYPFGEREIAALAAALDDVAARSGVGVCFLPFQHDRNNEDNEMHQKVVAKMARKDKTRVVDWTSDLEKLNEVFRGATAILAMRLHAAVFGVAVGRPVIVMPYDRKVDEFADLVGIKARIGRNMTGESGPIASLIIESMNHCEGGDGAGEIAWETVRLIS